MTGSRSSILVSLCLLASSVVAGDWPQFRGPQGLGRSASSDIPIRWSDTENLAWRTPLPGGGSSSPIVVGDRIYLTAFSGYGLDPANPGEKADLRLHILCYDLRDGEHLWTCTVEPDPAEQDVTPRIADHGYASPTPVCDGRRVYAFFGPSGLVACSLDGDLVWRRSAGTNTAGFGAASSPIVYRDLVILNASIESRSLRAFESTTGEEVWRRDDIERTWSTPSIVTPETGKDELVISQKNRLLALNPLTGEELWHCYGIQDYVVPVLITHDDMIYCSGGRQNQTLAVRSGGRGDVTDTHLVWEASYGANVTSPVYHDGYLFWSHDKSRALCLRAEDGERIYRERLPTRNRVYASIVYANDHLFFTTRDAGVLVAPAEPEFNVIATNRLGDPNERFNATPAIAEDALILRSDAALYCVRKDSLRD